MDRIPLTQQLDLKSCNKEASWKLFRQIWNNFEIATDLTEATDHKRVATLLSVIGKDAIEVYNTFTWNRQGDSLKLKEVLKSSRNTALRRRTYLMRDISFIQEVRQWTKLLMNSSRS